MNKTLKSIAIIFSITVTVFLLISAASMTLWAAQPRDSSDTIGSLERLENIYKADIASRPKVEAEVWPKVAEFEAKLYDMKQANMQKVNVKVFKARTIASIQAFDIDSGERLFAQQFNHDTLKRIKQGIIKASTYAFEMGEMGMTEEPRFQLGYKMPDNRYFATYTMIAGKDDLVAPIATLEFGDIVKSGDDSGEEKRDIKKTIILRNTEILLAVAAFMEVTK